MAQARALWAHDEGVLEGGSDRRGDHHDADGVGVARWGPGDRMLSNYQWPAAYLRKTHQGEIFGLRVVLESWLVDAVQCLQCLG